MACSLPQLRYLLCLYSRLLRRDAGAADSWAGAWESMVPQPTKDALARASAELSVVAVERSLLPRAAHGDGVSASPEDAQAAAQQAALVRRALLLLRTCTATPGPARAPDEDGASSLSEEELKEVRFFVQPMAYYPAAGVNSQLISDRPHPPHTCPLQLSLPPQDWPHDLPLILQSKACPFFAGGEGGSLCVHTQSRHKPPECALPGRPSRASVSGSKRRLLPDPPLLR